MKKRSEQNLAERHQIKPGHFPDHLSNQPSGHISGSLQKKTLPRKFISAIIGLLIFISIILVVFYCSYYYSIMDSNNKYETSLKANINSINSANKSLNILNSDKTLMKDKDKINSQLSKVINSLESTKMKVASLIPTEKYTDVQKQFEAGLQRNIDMFYQLKAILPSTDSADVKSSLATLTGFQNQCTASYKFINGKGFSLSLPQNVIETINALTKYINTIADLKTDEALLKTENKSFFDNITYIYNEFSQVYGESNFTQIAEKSRNGSQSYDISLDYVKKAYDSLQTVRDIFINITLSTTDSDAKIIYNTLKSLINTYDDYIQSFSSSLAKEKTLAKNGSIGKSDIKLLYNKTDTCYTALTDNNSLFIRQYNSFQIKLNSTK